MRVPIRSLRMKLEASTRCDFCHVPVPAGREMQVIRGSSEIKAQGKYCSVAHYHAALRDYEQKEKEIKLKERAQE